MKKTGLGWHERDEPKGRGRRLRPNFLVLVVVAATGLMPPLLNGQDLNDTSFSGTTITYYQSPAVANCRSDCNGNPNCQGFTWIKPGAYNRGDAAMCYLMSAVTAKVSHPCCISGVKSGVQTPGGSVGGSGGGTPSGVSLLGNWTITCCNEGLHWTLNINQQQGNTFSGAFSNEHYGGDITNGQLRGNVIEFYRIVHDFSEIWRQHWSGQLVNDGGRLRMINGTATGDQVGDHPGWHAEKQ